MSAEVAVYVQSKYAKPAYTVESYNVRAWPGLEMVCHALRQAGIEVGYANGLLRISLNKARARRIPIQVGGQSES